VEERPWRGPGERRWEREPEPEFPDGADTPPAHVSRRALLGLLGASAAMAGASACSRGPREDIVPYVNQPPEVVPSVPSRYATVMAVDGYGIGVVAESHVGRPTKLEGNPLHPASLGALGTIEQASILDLYDPRRMQRIARDGLPVTWRAFADAVAASPAGRGATHVLLGPTSAPHLVDLVRRVRSRGVVVHFDAPVSRRSAWEGAKLAFGRVVEPRWDFARADVVVALDADFLAATAAPQAWAGAWASRRRLDGPAGSMSRLYIVEARLTVTGMSADERLCVQAREVEGIAADLLAHLVALGGGPGEPSSHSRKRADSHDDVRRAAASRAAGEHAAWVRGVARDLRAHAGTSLVIAGDGQPPVVHALAHAMNELLGNSGRAVSYGRSPIFEAGEDTHGLESLTRAIDAGDVATLVVIGGDPVYAAPADLGFAERLRRVATTAYVGARETATARACTWTAPEAHWLEAWSDALAFDGTASIAQPLVRPLVDGRSAAQVLTEMVGEPDADSRDLVVAYWRAHVQGDFEAAWREALVHGVVGGTALAPHEARVDWTPIARALATPASPPAALEIAYYADAKVYDGRFADNAWLQELADPVTKLTWDNAALVGPATASRLGVAAEDVVVLEVRGREVRAPVLVVPGMADDVVALALGYGQTVPDSLSNGVGANAYALRDSRAPWFDEATVRKAGDTWRLALTQEHWSMEGRPIVLRRTLDEYRKDPDFAKPQNEPPRLLYELKPDGQHQWGMTIDLGACTGCSACVVACMAENNIPVVGKGGVRLSREMHWLRIDRYFVGDPRAPAAVTQPMLCQHCENAPCEYVCPVNATVHSHDGLNEMVYNRCVGTRFCSNNCPYKVRRFNFFNYSVDKPESVQLVMNPDVTVRARGVMEKCTYCVQRIREAEIASRRERRPLVDGEIVTACEQTCPTHAIVFGDIADPGSRVSKSRQNGRLYQVLHELGTVPRTRYLARIVNPNPELRGG
jgi:molybdopterin-containing oxidoreductase family iron-sulfur binding subunit